MFTAPPQTHIHTHTKKLWLTDTFKHLVNPLLCVCPLLCSPARLSLDTMAIESDGEREDEEEKHNSVFESTDQQQTLTHTAWPGDETDGPTLRVPCPRAKVTNTFRLTLSVALSFILSSKTGHKYRLLFLKVGIINFLKQLGTIDFIHYSKGRK